MLGATIFRRPHATWHAPPMYPPTTWLTLYSLKTQLTGWNQEKHAALHMQLWGWHVLWEWVNGLHVFFELFQIMFVSVYVWSWFTLNYACMYLKLAQVLQLAASLFVLHFVLDMPITWSWARCPCCDIWIQFIAGAREPDEWCYRCWMLWLDWYAEKKWAITRAYIVMLARKSLQDNPKWI